MMFLLFVFCFGFELGFPPFLGRNLAGHAAIMLAALPGLIGLQSRKP
jgi:hypothetical protein